MIEPLSRRLADQPISERDQFWQARALGAVDHIVSKCRCEFDSREEPHQPARCKIVARHDAAGKCYTTAVNRRLQHGSGRGALSRRRKSSEDGIDLTLSLADGTSETLRTQQVIAALPPRLLEATVAFTPDQDVMTAKRWRDTPTWMAPHAKFFALYDRPFWRDAGLSGTAQSMVGPMVEMHDATTASGNAALFGFLGVAAEERESMGEEALTRACINQFARIYGAEARRPRKTLFKDWAADPLTATAADRVASGHMVGSDVSWVSGPWQKRLVLAGSETSPSEPGYLAGAVAGATRAVDIIGTR